MLKLCVVLIAMFCLIVPIIFDGVEFSSTPAYMDYTIFIVSVAALAILFL